MDQEPGSLGKDFHLKKPRKYWGLRPWKRHSTILMVVGFLYALAGTQYIITGPSKIRDLALAAALQIAPLQFWGGVFIVAGLMSMLSSRWPPAASSWGYMVLTGLTSGWSAVYLTSIIFFHAPWSNIGQVIIWGCLGFIWWAISGFPNPDTAVMSNGRV
jgi:hypothetical protein